MVTEITNKELQKQKEYIQKVKQINSEREQMPLAHVHSFGCQQNVSDGEKIKGMLAEMGYGFTPDTAFADLILFNTCAVRRAAEEHVGRFGARPGVVAIDCAERCAIHEHGVHIYGG